MVIILMGVSGCGKTTIGKKLAGKFSWNFFEGDNYHPDSNIKKMSEGKPLNDSDREPWLLALRKIIGDSLNQNENIVMSCSALKEKYRIILKVNDDVKFIYLKGSYDLIKERMEKRNNHYMKSDLLKSQFDTLEEPIDAITVSIEQTEHEILQKIITRLELDKFN